MTSMWRRAMLYLGLGPDDEYEEDYEDPHGYGAPAPPPPVAPPPEPHSGVRALPREDTGVGRPRPLGSVVRPITPVPAAKIARVTPSAFNDAQEIADKFKAGQGVVVNLEGLDRDVARRLIDFASGLCYGLSGQMERVGREVYLLTPSNVEVSAEEKRRLQERSQA
jgi:cell division inhibitor SepF